MVLIQAPPSSFETQLYKQAGQLVPSTIFSTCASTVGKNRRNGNNAHTIGAFFFDISVTRKILPRCCLHCPFVNCFLCSFHVHGPFLSLSSFAVFVLRSLFARRIRVPFVHLLALNFVQSVVQALYAHANFRSLSLSKLRSPLSLSLFYVHIYALAISPFHHFITLPPSLTFYSAVCADLLLRISNVDFIRL